MATGRTVMDKSLGSSWMVNISKSMSVMLGLTKSEFSTSITSSSGT
eukprot:CAMPEP_0119078988 /NCGR_PEP_ID=MMETSP1178-20130426/104103_1 /TAXON_ID=33656 /ORGANISM="unid sp, Strain CCMP2000" /LENGTH=45 /DNA_ID= /DNA_START= /DNA_END= /DNA_ORIENTATION=